MQSTSPDYCVPGGDDSVIVDVVPQPSLPSPDWSSVAGDNFEPLACMDTMEDLGELDAEKLVSEEDMFISSGTLSPLMDLFGTEDLLPQLNLDTDSLPNLQDGVKETAQKDHVTSPEHSFDTASERLDEQEMSEHGSDVDYVAFVIRGDEEDDHSDDEGSITGSHCSDWVQPVRAEQGSSVASGHVSAIKRTAVPTVVCVQPSMRDVRPCKLESRRSSAHRDVVAPAPSPSTTDQSVDAGRSSAAVQARINRQKKKAYVQGLESEVEVLKKENGELRAQSSKLSEAKDSLEEEVAYLRNVLANQSTLSALLGNIGDVDAVHLTSSFVNDRKRHASSCLDHDYGKCSTKRVRPGGPDESMSSGICLHVDKDQVSMEFCSKCARMAKEPEP